MKQGIKQGIEKGIEQGVEIGLTKGKLEVAKSMIIADFPDAQILAFTGLTQSQIDNMKHSLS